MRESLKFYIDGKWVEPVAPTTREIVNPATEKVFGVIAMGNAEDVNKAVAAARRAFKTFSRTTREERLALLETLIGEYRKRRPDLAKAITEEMGAPKQLAENLHAAIGQIHLRTAQNVLKTFEFEEMRNATRITLEPIGVCGFITPWNWPINQIAAKVAPAIACGCTVVLKPSEYSPFSAQIWAEILDAAKVPPGVFNMVQGDGPTVGAAIAAHPDVDMVSFTGSERAGIEVARTAAYTIKRVHQELGGKSANIILPDADFEAAVTNGIKHLINNAGQSCNAPTRMLVPAERMSEAAEVAKKVISAIKVGDPLESPDVGPVVSDVQYNRIQELIQAGIKEGANVAVGGPGRPPGLSAGYFVQPTVFTNVTNDMKIAREEIFGPVLSVIGYKNVQEAVDIANDSDFGLAGYIQGKDRKTIADVAAQLRVGQVVINNAPPDAMAPFGGFKHSGNGREWGDHAFEAYLELKAVLGGDVPAAAEA